MLRDLESNFSVLEKQVLKFKKNYNDLQEKYTELANDYEQLSERFDDERKKNQELTEQSKNIKLQSAITGNPDHNRLMKNYINRLIKEVDMCIAELQNTGM